eukprot:COSAG01_NODE_26472_length_713_cov_0.785016_2_plen_61_part_00
MLGEGYRCGFVCTDLACLEAAKDPKGRPFSVRGMAMSCAVHLRVAKSIIDLCMILLADFI